MERFNNCRLTFLVLLAIFWIRTCRGANVMTEAQVTAAGKVMRNVCQPKTKVTNEQIDAMHKGNWDDAPETKCYMGCIAQMLKMVKGGKLQYDYIMKQAETLPESLRDGSKKAIDNCKDSITNPEKCEAGYQMSKCLYNFDPTKYFLP